MKRESHFLTSVTEADVKMITLESCFDHLDDAFVACEQMFNTRQVVKESRHLGGRELKFVRKGVEGWTNYFGLPNPVKPSLESANSVTARHLALEFIGDAIRSIYEMIKGVINWVIEAIGNLFGGSSGGGGGSSSGGGAAGLTTQQTQVVQEIATNAVAIEEAVQERITSGKIEFDVASLGILGVKSPEVSMEDFLRFLDKTRTKIVAVKQYALECAKFGKREIQDSPDKAIATLEFIAKGPNGAEKFSINEGDRYEFPGMEGFKFELIDETLSVICANVFDKDTYEIKTGQKTFTDKDKYGSEKLSLKGITATRVKDFTKGIGDLDKNIKYTADVALDIRKVLEEQLGGIEEKIKELDALTESDEDKQVMAQERKDMVLYKSYMLSIKNTVMFCASCNIAATKVTVMLNGIVGGLKPKKTKPSK